MHSTLGIRRLLRDGAKSGELIFVLWFDHLIHDQETFVRTVVEAEAAVKIWGETSPVWYRALIIRRTSWGISNQPFEIWQTNVCEIARGKYQPDQETAKSLFETGKYLWNTGYFVSTIDYVLERYKKAQTATESMRPYEMRR